MMLIVTLRRAIDSTVRHGGRSCCSIVWEDFREGVLSNTHTIDERRDDSRLQVRYEVEYSSDWERSRGAALEEDIGGAACTPPTDGAHLRGPRRRDAAASSASEEEGQAPFLLDKKKPALPPTRSPMMLAAHPPPRQPPRGTIGIGIAIDSRERAGRCYISPRLQS